jgi:hypothetical protein
MVSPAAIQRAVDQLRPLNARVAAGGDDLNGGLAARDVVMPTYGKLFAPASIPNLTEDQFLPFLRYSVNKHWTGLHRQGPKIVRDMSRLRRALAILVDESRPVRVRLDEVVDGSASVPGLGRAVLTPILMVVYPDRYTVWNRTSEAGMRHLGIWPDFERGMSFGERYELVNGIAIEVGKALGTDHWILDFLWWRARNPQGAMSEEGDEQGGGDVEPIGTVGDEPQRFGLERHLHEFLRDNWPKTSLGRDWTIFEEDGEPDAGFKYTTDVGEIDLLARHKHKKAWLVVELKRDRTSDTAVGQVLRYMGWVRRKLAASGEDVQGLIVARSAEPGLAYAIADLPSVKMQTYEVEFRLKDAPPLDAAGMA